MRTSAIGSNAGGSVAQATPKALRSSNPGAAAGPDPAHVSARGALARARQHCRRNPLRPGAAAADNAGRKD